MAASTSSGKMPELSKAEYLKRYLSTDENMKKSKKKIKKKNPKIPQKGLKIVDDDIDWRQMVKEEEVIEEDEEEAPVIAEVIDERPEEVKQLEAFRTGNRWKVIGADENEDLEEETNVHNSPELSSKKRHDSPDVSPPRRGRHDSPDVSPPRRGRHDSPDISPPRRGRHDSPDMSPPRRGRHDSPDMSPPRKRHHDSQDFLPPKQNVQRKDSSPNRKKPTSSSSNKPSPDFHPSSLVKKARKRYNPDSGQSSPQRRSQKREASDSDQSPPRMRSKTNQASDSDQSPPRRQRHSGKASEEDLSPPRRPGHSEGPRMLSGGKAGLASADVLRKEQDENRSRRRDVSFEEEFRNAQTVFREKGGKIRNLDLEREEQRRKAGEKAVKDEKYAQWGKGLAQTQMHQQKLEDALHEAQKPLARHCDDEDLDRMLREQEREGDPMAAMLRRKKSRATTTIEKPRYKGPTPPPNRFNLLPGYRWDGVDRSNGFEKKRYMRMADKKAVQEAAYKWSVEDM